MIMNYRFWIILLLIRSSLGFRKCNDENFCSSLRNHQPADDQLYAANINSLALNGDATIDLTNSAGKTVQLQISALNNDQFRLQFIEKGNNRYKLTDVLVKEPQTQSITYEAKTESSVTISVNEASSAKVTIQNDPLTINVLVNDTIVASIPGYKLYFENTDQSQAFTVQIDFPNAQSIFGIHEHADKLELQNTANTNIDPYRLKNLDVFGYGVGATSSIYGAIPVLYAYSSNKTSGTFLHNAAQQWVDINTNNTVSAYFMVEGGSLDIFTLPGPTPRDALKQYIDLTGKAHLPPMWALGYHQSRHSYDNQEDVKNVIANMDTYDFPVETIWLDIDYTNGMKYFTWNPDTFNNPTELQRNLSSTNRKLIPIIDPHIKVDSSYPVYQGAADRDLYVKNPDGSNFEGDCWPGLSSYLDFLNPDTIDYYADQYSYENFPQTTDTIGGIWNDMNEPSVFNLDAHENTLPADSIQFGGVKHRDVHNIYGMLHTKSTHQGLLKRDDNKKRPFVLSRSTFAGSQRYAAFWTGDNQASWEYLAISVPMCLNANILGLVFCGADVGGYNNIPTDELFGRWYQVGAWLPFFRAHSTKTVPRREPYLFNENVQKIVRDAIKLRYAHLPVWYTLFYEHTRYGEPIIRPLFYEYPKDSATIGIENQLLVGEDILVRAVTDSNQNNVDVYFPGENNYWYQLNNQQFFKGGSRQDIQVDSSFIPIYYRSGSVIARKDTQRASTADQATDPYTVYVNLGPNDQNATGRLYVDDNVSFEYENSGAYIYAELIYDGNSVNVKRIDGNGSDSDFPITIDKVVVNKANDFGQSIGTYEKKIFRNSIDGKPLSGIKINTVLGQKIRLL